MLAFENFENFEYMHKGMLDYFIKNEDIRSNRINQDCIICKVKKPRVSKGYSESWNNFGYKGSYKLKSLYKNYYDKDDFEVFLDNVKNGKDCVYYFPQRKKQTHYKPNCLVTITYNSNVKCMCIFWRATECIARLYADLVFLSEILPDVETVCVFSKVSILTEAIYGVYFMNGWKIPKPKWENVRNRILFYKEKYYDVNSDFSTFMPVKLIQEKYFNHLKSLKLN